MNPMNFEPVCGPFSQAIILGSLPSPKSRQQGFYYGHPQNRFWPLLARICSAGVPLDIPAKKRLILDNGLALWDVLQACTIEGAADASIKDPVLADLPSLFAGTGIKAVFCNGAAAHTFYQRYAAQKTGIPAYKLPSTSPANASFSAQRLYECWQPQLAPWILQGKSKSSY